MLRIVIELIFYGVPDSTSYKGEWILDKCRLPHGVNLLTDFSGSIK